MLKIVGTHIYMTRGDSVVITLSIKDENGEEYELQDGDVVGFTMKKNIDDKDYIMQKTFVDKEIQLKSSDTNTLPFGKYFYDVEIIFIDKQPFTVIPPSIIELETEVHTNG